MQLNDEQLQTIETFGGLNYPPEKIVMILALDREEFFLDFNISDTDPGYAPGQSRYHYDRGQLIAQAKIDKANLKRAEEGNLTSVAQYKKETAYRNLQNAKQRILFHQGKTYLDDLKQLIETGRAANLTEYQVQHIEQLDFIRSLHFRWNSKPFIISALRQKWPGISKHNATVLYNDAINFFFLDNEIKLAAWKNVYAGKLDDLAALAVEMDDIEQARRCIVEAADIRGVKKEDAQQIPREMLDQRFVVYTTDIASIGIPKVNQKELAGLIESFDLTAPEKLKIKRDALIEDVPFELFIDDEEEA